LFPWGIVREHTSTQAWCSKGACHRTNTHTHTHTPTPTHNHSPTTTTHTHTATHTHTHTHTQATWSPNPVVFFRSPSISLKVGLDRDRRGGTHPPDLSRPLLFSIQTSSETLV